MFPKLVTLGPFTLHTYGLLVALGLFAGIWTAGRFARRSGLERETVINLGIYVALAALLGAKLALLGNQFSYYWEHPGEIFSLAWLQAGGVFYGGLAAAALTALWFARRYGLSFAALGDAYAPGIALGHAVGRLGCFAAGCCWGKPTELSWAVTFTDPYSARIVGVPLEVGLHPTQLYEAAAEALLFALLVWLSPRRRFPGMILLSYLALYGAARFGIEFLRDDPRGPLLLGGSLSLPQGLSLGLVLTAVLLWLWQWRRAASPRHAR